jgi:hypothetical protein
VTRTPGIRPRDPHLGQHSPRDGRHRRTATARSPSVADTAGIAGKADASAVYTKARVDAAVQAALLGTVTIPSGTTVTGVGNDDVYVDAQLPGVAPVDLTSATVNFAESPGVTTDGDPQCTGTAAAPTAPAGKVCIYRQNSVNLDGLHGSSADVAAFSDRMFFVIFNVDAATGSDVWLDFSWAYTAP